MSGTTSAEGSDQGTREPSTAGGRRLVVVDAFIDLVLERGSPPTPEDVADRAGVSRATFFRYFSTLVELRGEAAARVVERFPGLLAIADVGIGELDDRIRRFVDSRTEMHEVLHPLELLMRSHAVHDDEAARFVDAARRVLADQARRHFAPELEHLGPARRDDLVTAIAVLTSVESWQQFRCSHDRSLVQTRRAWRWVLAALLGEPSTSS